MGDTYTSNTHYAADKPKDPYKAKVCASQLLGVSNARIWRKMWVFKRNWRIFSRLWIQIRLVWWQHFRVVMVFLSLEQWYLTPHLPHLHSFFQRPLGANAENRLLLEEKMESIWCLRPTSIPAKPQNWIKILVSTSHFTTDSMYPISTTSLILQGEWVSISGKAELSKDRTKVAKYYSPTLKAWLGDLGDGIHDGSPNDPVCHRLFGQ